MPRVLIAYVELSDIQHFTEAAKREDAHIYEGLKRIMWHGAFIDTEIVGCIGLLQPYAAKTEVRIRGWYVRPENRRQGIGLVLLEHAVNTARVMNYEWVEMKTKYIETAEKMGGWVYTGKVYTSFAGQKTKSGNGYQLIYPITSRPKGIE